VEYFNTDDGVQRGMFLREGNGEIGFGDALGSPVRTLRAGQDFPERRNVGVYGPGFTDPQFGVRGRMSRRGDVIRLGPTLLNDSLNWAGFPTNLKRPRLTLDRDGKRIFDRTGNDFDVEVPAGTRTYRLGADLDRGPLQALSTRVTCEWTFRSGTVGGDAWKPLPLSAVRFLPPLSGENAAPAGNTFVIPFEVQRQPGSAAGTVRELTVEVSYDDGATWRPASVLRLRQQGVAVVRHPAGPGFASLRARSTDSAGNTLSETIIRAYRLA